MEKQQFWTELDNDFVMWNFNKIAGYPWHEQQSFYIQRSCGGCVTSKTPISMAERGPTRGRYPKGAQWVLFFAQVHRFHPTRGSMLCGLGCLVSWVSSLSQNCLQMPHFFPVETQWEAFTYSRAKIAPGVQLIDPLYFPQRSDSHWLLWGNVASRALGVL